MTTYLVTGASGYVGGRLVRRLLKEGHRVLVLDKEQSGIAELCALSDRAVHLPVSADPQAYRRAFFEEKVDLIFHLASRVSYACALDEVASMIGANVTLGAQLLEAMDGSPCDKFVNVGTYWQHYSGPAYNPICLYAATKQAFMDIVTYYAKWRGVRAVSLKLTDVYGDNDPRPKIFSLVQKAAETGQPLSLTPGEQKISFLHVDDAVSALCIAAARAQKTTKGHEVFTAAMPLVTLKEAVGLFQKVKNIDAPLLWGGASYRDTQIMTPFTDPTLPDWTPQISLEEGLRSL